LGDRKGNWPVNTSVSKQLKTPWAVGVAVNVNRYREVA